MSTRPPRIGEVRKSGARTISDADIALFAALSYDFSRLHTDHTYASRGLFGQRVGHGLLGLCLAEGMLSRAGALRGIVFAWEWSFEAPLFAGDTMFAEATIERIEETALGAVALERIEVFKQDRVRIQVGRHKLALMADGRSFSDWIRMALEGPSDGFEEVHVVEEDSHLPSSTTSPVHARETGVFFENLEIGSRYVTPAYTIGDYDTGMFLGFTGESGEWFLSNSVARAAGLADRAVAPLYGLALVEGLKYCLAPNGGAGIPIASLSWRWKQMAPFFSGQTLRMEATVQGKRASRTKTDRGIIASRYRLIIVESGDAVQEGQHVQMFRRCVPPTQ
jgi:acyl dehydratase